MSRQTSLSILSASTPPPLSGSSRGSQIFTLYKHKNLPITPTNKHLHTSPNLLSLTCFLQKFVYLARKGMENGPQNYPDIEHDFEIQRLQVRWFLIIKKYV